MEVAVIVGYILLVASWIVPAYIKDLENKRLMRMILSALAAGVFAGHLLTTWC
jgi:hypothetical protein